MLHRGSLAGSCLLFGIGLFPSAAHAGTILLRATGNISDSSLTSIPVGSLFTAYLAYDATSVPLFSTADTANYTSPVPLRVEVAGSTLTGGNSSWEIFVANNLAFGPGGIWGIATGQDGIAWVSSVTATGPVAMDPLFNSFNEVLIAFHTANNAVLSSTALPAGFPELSKWDGAAFEFFSNLRGGGAASGRIDLLQLVPEPGTLMFVAVAVCAGAVLRRWRRS